MDRRRRIRLTFSAAAILATFVAFWVVSASLAPDQCGNADSVECTPLGWVMLYGLVALALGAAVSVLLVAVLWLIAGLQHLRRGRPGTHHSTRTS